MWRRTIKLQITLFDQLPTEILFMIFDYLSSTDILYTFFNFNQRMNHIVLNNQRYLTNIELPTSHLQFWKKIFSLIGSEILSLNINSCHLSIPLTYFPKVKSINICLPYGLSDKQFQSIVDNDLFDSLYSFQIKENQPFSHHGFHYTPMDRNYILEKVFNQKNSLKIFQYSLSIPSLNTKNFHLNSNIHTLILSSICFEDIFELMKFTPNLKYLNVQCPPPRRSDIFMKNINIKLEKFYLKLMAPYENSSFDQLINSLKEFSSSLICLALDLVDIETQDVDRFPFDSKQLQQLLKSLEKLKQFHLYAKIYQCVENKDIIFLRFQDPYWLEHNLSFGFYQQYLFTLPFHFDYFYGSDPDFDEVISNNPDMLLDNPRIWYNIKSITLSLFSPNKTNILNQLKIKMPKLTTIKLFDYSDPPSLNKTNLTTFNHVVLETVTTLEYRSKFLENYKDWMIYSLPNLKHLFLYDTILPSKHDQLASVFNQRIQQLDISACPALKQLADSSYRYFSNVKYISFSFTIYGNKHQWYANILRKLFIKLQNLKALLIYNDRHEEQFGYRSDDVAFELCLLIQQLSTNPNMKNYQMESFPTAAVFIKQNSNDNDVQNDTLLFLRKFSIFSNLSRFFNGKN